MELNNYKGIWIYAEQTYGVLSSVSFELLAKSKELQKISGEDVVAVLLSDKTGDMPQKLLNRGADKVIIVESPHLKDYKTISYACILEELANKYKPSIFLFGATSTGKDLAPRVMAKLRTGLTADCLELDIDENGILIQTKPSYGGNIMCKIICPSHRPQMATIRPRTFDPLDEVENYQGELIRESLNIAAEPDYEVLETIPNVKESMDIEESQIIVAAGRGIQSKEDMKMLEELTKLLGGTLAVTRPLVDVAWYGPSIQIGASGKTVKPKLIINVGISGAIQYNVGMQKSTSIVSINKNATAPIFGISHYGIVGDYKDIIPSLIEELKKNAK
jgi:electron transfer flavoprotein alpha subunit